MLLLGCSGPGAASLMLYHTDYGYKHSLVVCGLFTVSLILALFATRYRWLPIPIGVLLLFHPAWMMSVSRGDCGYGKADWSFAFSVIASSTLGLQFILFAVGAFRRVGRASRGPRGGDVA